MEKVYTEAREKQRRKASKLQLAERRKPTEAQFAYNNEYENKPLVGFSPALSLIVERGEQQKSSAHFIKALHDVRLIRERMRWRATGLGGGG